MGISDFHQEQIWWLEYGANQSTSIVYRIVLNGNFYIYFMK